MKIAIYFDSSISSGGAYHQNINLIDIFKQYLENDFDFTYITTKKDIQKIIENKGAKCIYFKKNIIIRLEEFFFKYSIIRDIYKKLSITNQFEKFLKKNNFDLIFFNAPYEISTLIINLNYIIILLSMQHRTVGYFPEYKGHHDNELRDYIISNASKKAFKIIVGAQKDKNLLIKFYNANEEKIKVQPYTFTLPYIYEKNKNHNYEKTFNDLNIPKKKIFLYPAQFWAHKNHKYLIDVAIDFKKNNLDNFVFVFCGFDKGNLKYIKKLIENNNLNDYFKIFDYLDDFQLISLYLKCFSITMPSYVGHTVLPMYEAFYFEKNIFYTKNLADENLKEHLTEIDINITDSVRKEYLKILENNSANISKIKNAKQFYNKNCAKEIIVNNFKNIFEEYIFIKNRWEE